MIAFGIIETTNNHYHMLELARQKVEEEPHQHSPLLPHDHLVLPLSLMK
jgi:hypothetical protein